MIILISGASHTGKTLVAQKLLNKYHFPYLSIDHLKMGLIRSKICDIAVDDDNNLTTYLWKIVQEIIKTALENNQNLIIEGGYIPFDWQKDFNSDELKQIKYFCLIMSPRYIAKEYNKIIQYENIIEKRLYTETTLEQLIIDNQKNLEGCEKYNLNYILIDEKYQFEIVL